MTVPPLPLVLRTPLRARLLAVGLLAGLLSGSVGVAVLADAVLVTVAAVVACASVGPLLLVALVRVVRPGAMTLTREGYEDRTSAFSVGPVPWSAVRRISVASIGGRPAVVVGLREEFLAERSWALRLLLRGNRWYGGDVAITQLGLPLPAEELAQLMSDVLSADSGA